MAVEIIMPKLGVDMQEGEILEWKKAEGDSVNEGDILLEIMSDKTNMEIEAEDSGVLLKIVHPAGDVVPVTEIIGYIGAEGEAVESSLQRTADKAVSDLTAAGLVVPPAVSVAKTNHDKVLLAAEQYDMIVVGGGPAGYYAAIRGSQLGAKVAIV